MRATCTLADLGTTSCSPQDAQGIPDWFQWGLAFSAIAVTLLLAMQIVFMRRLLTDPNRFAPWYNATGVSSYVLGMLAAALGLGGWI